MAVLRYVLLLALIAAAQCFVAPPAAHAHSLAQKNRAASALKAGDDDDKPSLFQLAGQFYNELMPWGDPSKVRLPFTKS
jgi:hypothetical protein